MRADLLLISGWLVRKQPLQVAVFRRVYEASYLGMNPILANCRVLYVIRLNRDDRTSNHREVVIQPSCGSSTQDFEGILVAISGLEPELFALRGRRVNQLHHIATERIEEPVATS